MTPQQTSTTNTLTGRTALVTGAGTGIGAATALALAAAGARVALLGRRVDRLDDVAASIADLTGRDDRAAVAVADVADRPRLAAAIDEARTELGSDFDLVCANAGVMLAAPFDEAPTDEWDAMVATNITGLLNTARTTIDDLTRTAAAGRPTDLVLISSIGAHITLPGYAVYTATKAAVTHLATNLRAELGPRGVRVRAIEPGMTESDLGQHMSNEQARAFLAEFTRTTPPMPASAIADSVVWSASLPAGTNVASLVVLPTIQG